MALDDKMVEILVGVSMKIKALPLSPHNHGDRWIWGGDKKGGFTVKFAYHIAQNRILEDDFSTPNPSATLWKHLWQAPVQGNVKVCVRKAAANILPTRSRLSERGIDIDTQCPFCDEEVESPIHALRDCPHAVSILQVANIPTLTNASCVANWLIAIYTLAPAAFSPLLMLIWATWRNRNSRIWEEDCKSAHELVPLTLGWWNDYKAAHVHPVRDNGLRVLHKWCKHSFGFIKLNVDAAFNMDTGLAGLGGIFLDHEGSVVGGFRHTLEVANSPRHAELLALIHGVQLALDHHLTPLVVESDCMDLVQAIPGSSLDHSDLGFLLSDLRALLIAALGARVGYGKRTTNLVAHSLAQEAKDGQFSVNFFTNCPPSVEAFVFSDCNDSPSMN
ncbi:uncharacterized protein LOC112184104 [Rosa chinensis]|uniref:uncharacterized protein LOC112184104 n=1 Tax=Rosa chinensis TaxID=74649 RepID=UPI000D08E37A|nr:uncharacterized protein LOC112184104 [Rosa chinensis]